MKEKESIEYQNIKKDLLEDQSFIYEIRKLIAETYFIYGESGRLHLSTHNSLVNTLFNTISGDIYIGEYTFTGHNVSIITGTHDIHLIGNERMGYPTSGGDIVIGSGVWICSNSVILGPCQIGDNAVIAAGSVVLPNTKIGEHELYVGIPAKFKKNLVSDLRFSDNYLPLYGFYEPEYTESGEFIQQWIKEKNAKFYYRLQGVDSNYLSITVVNFIPNQKIHILINDEEIYHVEIEEGISIHSIELQHILKQELEIGINIWVDLLKSPQQMGINQDERLIGVGIRDVHEE